MHGCLTITYCNQIHEAKDKDDDAACDDDTPERHAQRLLARRCLVEVAEHVNAKHEHGECKRDEAVSWAQQRPIASEIRAEK